jgi:hypothetical protein
MARVQTCADVDYDAITGVCAHPVWDTQPSLLPPLSAEDGSLLTAAIALVWITGAVFRWVREALD